MKFAKSQMKESRLSAMQYQLKLNTNNDYRMCVVCADVADNIHPQSE